MKKLNWIISILFLGLTACDSEKITTNSQENKVESNQLENDTLAAESVKVESSYPDIPFAGEKLEVEDVALYVLGELAELRYPSIDALQDKEGVSFSPTVGRAKEEMYLLKSAFSDQFLSDEVIDWGIYEASGEVSQMSFNEYVIRYVNNPRFHGVKMFVNEYNQRGTTINTIKENFPDDQLVEVFAEGTTSFDGMDWKSLNLIFSEKEGKFYLKAVIGDQWSI